MAKSKQDIVNMAPESIDNELTRNIWASFQLQAIKESIQSDKANHDQFRGEIGQKFDSIYIELKTFNDKFVTKEALETRLKPIEADVRSTSGNITWGVRIVVAAVIIALLSLVIINGGK